MKISSQQDSDTEIDFLHEIGMGMSAAPLSKVLDRIVRFVVAVMKCDSCFIYTLNDRDLVLRASKNLHSGLVDRLTIRFGQGITGWVAEHKKPVAITRKAYRTRGFNRSTSCRKTSSRHFCRCR
jgi:uroporphyrinogen-III synthase